VEDCKVEDVEEIGGIEVSVVVCELVVVLATVEELVVVVEMADAENSTTLFRPSSATHRFPEESRAIPSGVARSLWVAFKMPEEGIVTKSG
jgi:hypothetical protein